MNISVPSSEVHQHRSMCHGIGVWADEDQEHTWELLGDARDLADRLGQRVIAVVCRASPLASDQLTGLLEHGADDIVVAPYETDATSATLPHPMVSRAARLEAVTQWYQATRPRVLFIAASGCGRALAAQLAVRCDAELCSPTLLARLHDDRLQITTLHGDGKRAQQLVLAPDRPAILVMNKDVGQMRRVNAPRNGDVRYLAPTTTAAESVVSARRIDADPAKTAIEHLPRLVAGGHGLGNREGFQLLRSVAARLSAGVAASRLAVDSGWIERERQVGQTGKTVRPELYIACAISGASHHLEGMSQSRHILAINTDPQAPIFRVAHLGLVADWRQTLMKLESLLPSPK